MNSYNMNSFKILVVCNETGTKAGVISLVITFSTKMGTSVSITLVERESN